MTAKNLYSFLVEKGLEKKLAKRELYDEIIEKFQISSKQLGGYISVLSRKGALDSAKTTITIHEIVWE